MCVTDYCDLKTPFWGAVSFLCMLLFFKGATLWDLLCLSFLAAFTPGQQGLRESHPYGIHWHCFFSSTRRAVRVGFYSHCSYLLVIYTITLSLYTAAEWTLIALLCKALQRFLPRLQTQRLGKDFSSGLLYRFTWMRTMRNIKIFYLSSNCFLTGELSKHKREYTSQCKKQCKVLCVTWILRDPHQD